MSRAAPARLPALLLGLVLATAALTPLLGVPIHGRNLGHDADFALAALHFMEGGIREGRWWPRWVMATNFGLGGTTFYTYPPLAYWVAALVRIRSGLPAAEVLALSVAAWRLVFVAGAFLWLRRHVPPGPALAGAALAALLPYPALVNPWIRFAHAEVAGAALLPFLLLATERAAEARGGEGIPALALAFAALAMTHLPGCVLAAHLVPLYALAYGGARGALRAGLGGLGGAGLAACFLLPAAVLLREMSFEGRDDGTWAGSLLFWARLEGAAEWRQFLLMVWGAAILALAAGLGGRWLAAEAGPRPLRRAALLLLLAAFALMTAATLPLWLWLAPLRSVEFPWRASGFLGLPVAAFTALALAAGARRAVPAVAALGLGLAALPPGWLLAISLLGNPDWPRFQPAEARLARALASPRGVSSEHLPVVAMAAGWGAAWQGSETAPAADPWPRPTLPAGAERIPGGFRLAAAAAPVTLPQFYFSAWRAEDDGGAALPVRPTAEGFLQVVVDRPVRGVRVMIATTPAEWAGWAVTGLSAALLLAWGLRRPRAAGPEPAHAPTATTTASPTAGPARALSRRVPPPPWAAGRSAGMVAPCASSCSASSCCLPPCPPGRPTSSLPPGTSPG